MWFETLGFPISERRFRLGFETLRSPISNPRSAGSLIAEAVFASLLAIPDFRSQIRSNLQSQISSSLRAASLIDQMLMTSDQRIKKGRTQLMSLRRIIFS